MKSTKLLIFNLLLAISSSGFAQKINATCTPSVVNNYAPCDAGYSGKKYKTTTVTCPAEWPSGVVSTTPTFNTSQCVKIPDLPPVDRTCELTPAACAPQPRSPGCPTGKHWTLTGATVAHCVDNDPVCPWGTSLTHDGRGNPSCVANTCPSNQVMQSDGISCACPAGTAWNGGSCVPLPPPCTSSVTNGSNVACDVGYTGFKFGVTTTTCPGNVVTFAWDTSGCTPIPTCTPSTIIGSNVACDIGYTGFKHLVTTTTCPGNATSSYWDTSACVPTPPPPVCPPPITTSGSCPAGYTGNITTTTTYSGASCTPSYTTSSACSPIITSMCSNGATNWPDCNDTCWPDPFFYGVFTGGFFDPGGRGSNIVEGIVLTGCFGPEIKGKEGDQVLLSGCGWIWNGGGYEYPREPSSKTDPDLRDFGKSTFLSICKKGTWSRLGDDMK